MPEEDEAMMEELIKEIMIPAILTIGGGSFTGAAVIAWWGVRRLVEGQDQTNETLQHISTQLAEAKQEIAVAKERVGSLERREDKRERDMEVRHRDNAKSFDRVWHALRELGAGGARIE
jgi:hypothetical protein